MLSYEQYELVRDHYWVGAYRSELWNRSDSPKPFWFGWVFGVDKPQQMPNQQMYWRRPTYEEALRRQRAYDDNPQKFMKLCEDYRR